MSRYSPGNYYLKVPKERRKNLAFRRFILKKCRADVRFRRAVLEMCRRDIIFFINVFVWQFNPNALGKNSVKLGPFVTWAYQEAAIKTILRCIEERSDLVIEKSREMGASWLCLIVMLWFVIFHPNMTFLCISRNAEMVDKADFPDCLFWKLDFIIDHLPEWVIEKGPRKRLSRKKFSIAVKHKLGKSTIAGQATTGKMGVGGRCDAMFLDEFSQVKEAWEVLNKTSDTTACRIFNGTHKGANTAFNDLCTKSDNSIVKLVMHWTSHPDKWPGAYRWDAESHRVEYLDKDYEHDANFVPICDGSPTGGPCPGIRSPWYDLQCLRKTNARGVAEDLDINPAGSVEQVFSPLLIKDLQVRFCREPVECCDLIYDKFSAEPRRFWPEVGGPFRIWQRLSADGKPPEGTYAFCADVALGTRATPSCLSGVHCETGEKILEYVNDGIEPKDFAYLIVAVCRLYAFGDKTPKLAWEVPGPGLTVTKHVLALGYRNIYMRKSDYRLKRQESEEVGWNNNRESMKALIEDYKDALRERKFLNRSKEALSECLAFMHHPDGYVYHTGWKDPKDPSAVGVNHGDRVVADALCWKMAYEMGRLVDFDPAEAEREPPLPSDGILIGGLAGRRLLDKNARRNTGGWAGSE